MKSNEVTGYIKEYKGGSDCLYLRLQMSYGSWPMMNKKKIKVFNQRQKPVKAKGSSRNKDLLCEAVPW